MVELPRKLFILLLSGVFLLSQWGCATGRHEYPKPEPLSEQYREQLGTIGVAISPWFPDIQFDKTLSQSTGGGLAGMGRGAVEGAKNSWEWWSDLCGKPFESGYTEKRMVGVVIGQVALPLVVFVLAGVCYILTPPVAFFGGLGGGIYGVLPSSPDYPRYVEGTEAFFRHTLARYPIQETFQSAFLNEARARTSHMFVVVPEEGSQPSEGMVGQALDTVLELSVEKIWLKRLDEGEGEWNPPMVLVLVVRAKLVQSTEKTEWYDQTFVHEMEKRPYDSWVYPIRFQEGIEKAYQHLAEEIVQKLFIHIPSTSSGKIDTSAFFSETTLISQK